jgi:hypothetical protein
MSSVEAAQTLWMPQSGATTARVPRVVVTGIITSAGRLPLMKAVFRVSV